MPLIECPRCLHELKVDQGQQWVHCPYCGHDADTDDEEEEIEWLSE